MAHTYRFVIGSAEAGLRLDHYLARHLPSDISRSAIQRVIRGGRATVGDRSVKVHYKLRSGDVVSALLYEVPARGGEAALSPQPIPLEIVYEDAHLLVVNKPAGLVTHPAPGHWDGTLVNAILWHLGYQDAEVGKTLPRAGIVHRLDKETSGLLLVAKTDGAHLALSRQLKARTIHRRYVALAEGHVPLDTGTVNAPIGRHHVHRKVMAVRHLGGRNAVTHYRVVKRFGLPRHGTPTHVDSENRLALPYTLLDVSLDTGRTHQIRVHLCHLGHPVLGDTTYGSRPASFWKLVGITRQLLHAYRLSFQHPVTRQPVTVSASIPEDILQWMDGETARRLKDAT